METLTYPYGETPEEVIRGRWSHVLAFEPNPDNHVTQMVVAFSGADDLLTVLDALKVAKEHLLHYSETMDETRGAELERVDSMHDLRLSILSALGITES